MLNPNDYDFTNFPYIGTSFMEAENADKDPMRNLGAYKSIQLTQDMVSKYANEYPEIAHVLTNDRTQAYIWTDPKDDKILIGFVSVETKENGEKWIIALQVMPQFRRKGLGRQILQFATDTLGAKYASILIKNKIAAHMYRRAGFTIYRSTADQYFMKKG